MKILTNRKLRLLFCLLIGCSSFYSFDSQSEYKNIPKQAINLLELIPLKDSVKVLIQKEAYEEGIRLVKEASQFYLEQKDWSNYTECTILLADLTGYQDFDLMLEYANLALKNMHSYQLENDTMEIEAKHLKAIALMELNRPDTALIIFKDILSFLATSNQWKKVITQEYYLFSYYYQLQNLDSAKLHIQNGLDIGKKYHVNTYETTFLNALSVINYREGDYQNAIQSTLNIIEDQEKIKFPNTVEKLFLSKNYKNLALFYNIKGEYKRAKGCYYKINEIYNFNEQEIVEEFNQHFNNISKILSRENNFVAAIANLRKSIAYNNSIEIKTEKERKRLQQNLVVSYNELAQNWSKLEETDSITYYVEKSLAISLEEEKHIPYLRLGKKNILSKEGNLAIMNLNKSLSICNALPQKDPNYLFSIYHHLGEAYKLKKDYPTAILNLQKSFAANCTSFKDTNNIYAVSPLLNIAFPLEFLDGLQLKAQLFKLNSPHEKDQKASLETYQLAIQYIDTLQNSYVLEGAQLFWSKKFKEIYGETIDLCYQFYQNTNDPKYLKLAFDISEKSKALLLLEGLKDTEGKAVAGLPDSLIQKEKDLKIDLAFYEKSLKTAQEKKQEDRIQLYQTYLADTRLNLGRLKEQMEADYPGYYQLKYANTTISIPEIQEKLIDQKTALLTYFLGAEKGYAFVISEETQAFIQIDSLAVIRQKTNTFLHQLKYPHAFREDAKSAFQQYNQAGYALYQAVLAAACNSLPASINQLIIAPDDALNNLPFEVLPNKLIAQPSKNFGSLPYLLKQFQIHYTYSANLLWKNRERQEQLPSNTECLAFAPPYEGNQLMAARGNLEAVRGGVANLQGTSREIQGIANYFEGSYDSSAGATEANFKATASQYGVLHLAMHGEANGKDEAHLIFTNLSKDSTEDNLLYHYEIANMDLPAQLAVLSACETGVGKYVQGEGVFSLARSFMYAGVPSIAMTLWQVNDGATSVMMPYFYKNLAAGLSKKAALHQAKLEFFTKARLEYRHPYYWSGFVLLGEGGALKMEENPIYWIISLGLLALGVFVFWRSRQKV